MSFEAIYFKVNFSINCSINCTDGGKDAGISLDADPIMRIIYLIIGLIGISDNAVIACVLLHFRYLRTNLTNTFIINQSIIDGTAAFFILLSTFIRDVSVIKDPIAQELFCRLWLTNMPIWGIFVSSTYNMVALTFERYSAIVHPLTHQRHFTRKKAMIFIIIIWITGPAFNAAYMVPTAGMVDGECTVLSIWPNAAIHTFVGLLSVFVQYFLPLVLIIYAYTRIILTLKKSSHIGEDSNRENRIIKARKNVIKTLFLVSACFVFCWSWNQIYYTMYNCGFDANFNSSFYHFTVIMVFMNCCMNPIIYAIKYEQFQKAFCVLCMCEIKRKTDSNSTCISKLTSTEADDNRNDVIEMEANPKGGCGNPYVNDLNTIQHANDDKSIKIQDKQNINIYGDHNKLQNDISIISENDIYNTRL